jgi:hypothetical protein
MCESFGGWGVTGIDALSTLMLMNLTEDIASVRSQIEKVDFRKSVTNTVVNSKPHKLTFYV